MRDSIEIPFVTTRVLVISDFNCPYCFTLNEWLHSMGASDRVCWVGVEHRPDLPLDGKNAEADEQTLEKEIADVLHRAPGLGLSRPGLWQNSRQALLIQNALEDEEPQLAHQVRLQLFRIYWMKARALVMKDMAEVLQTFGLVVPELELDYLQQLTQWWRQELDRIPCMIAPTGAIHYGLQDQASVRAFINSALHGAGEGPGCSSTKR
jgi:hypothetical protein